jgi:adenylate cyclase
MVKKLLQGVMAGLIGSTLTFLIWLPGWLDTWEAKTWDWRVNLLAKPEEASPQIKLIMLDQNSLDWGEKENGLSWPWPREVYNTIINYCYLSDAKALAFDVLFTEPSKYGVADDGSFGNAIAKYERFVGSIFLSQSSGSEKRWPDYAPEKTIQIQGLEKWLAATKAKGIASPRATFSIPEISDNVAIMANVHLDPDHDGVYRRVRLFNIFDGRVIPSMALGAYLAAYPDTTLSIKRGIFSVGNLDIPIDNQGQAILNFRGPSGTHKTYSAAAVIQSELRLQNNETPPIKEKTPFKDCYVFFGFSAPGLYDLRPSPVSGVYPGVEIHSTTLDNLLSGDFIRDVSTPLVFGLLIFLTLLAGVATAYVSGIINSFLVYLLFILLPVGFCLAAYTQGLWLPLVFQELGITLTLFSAGAIYYSVEGRQKLFIKNAFKQYLSPAVIEELIQHPERLKLGGERRELSVFFSDLEGFTSISEKLEPEELTALLNEYLSAMTDIIQEEGGTVDKYEGDAIIAFWNAPLDQQDHAVRCVRAALRCQTKLAEMRPAIYQRIGKNLNMRIGINNGPAIVGNLGSKTRFDYTMLGDTVNLASRLEGINKQFGTYTIVSQSALDQMEGAFPAREVSRVTVVGRKEPVRIYEPMLPQEFSAREQDLKVFSDGLAAFYEGRFDQAEKLFGTLMDKDPAALAYTGKCRYFMDNPPTEWLGVWMVTTK